MLNILVILHYKVDSLEVDVWVWCLGVNDILSTYVMFNSCSSFDLELCS